MQFRMVQVEVIAVIMGNKDEKKGQQCGKREDQLLFKTCSQLVLGPRAPVRSPALSAAVQLAGRHGYKTSD